MSQTLLLQGLYLWTDSSALFKLIGIILAVFPVLRVRLLFCSEKVQ